MTGSSNSCDVMGQSAAEMWDGCPLPPSSLATSSLTCPASEPAVLKPLSKLSKLSECDPGMAAIPSADHPHPCPGEPSGGTPRWSKFDQWPSLAPCGAGVGTGDLEGKQAITCGLGSAGLESNRAGEEELFSASDGCARRMNNLVVLHATPSELGAKLEACAEMMDVDTHQGIVYGVSSEGRVIGVRSGDAGPPVVDEDIPYGGGVVCLRWIGELEGVFAACKGGQMLLLRDGEWETVGELDGGLVCAEWSTDDEVLLCVTGGGAMVVLNTSWDVLAERQLSGPPPVKASLAWNGDGLKCCLLTIDAAGKGAIALLNRDLKEEARSEDETNLCPSVAFGPDGGLIAASQRSSDKHEIIFFEPNGLRHYEFPLPKDRVCDQVAGMGWNVDGSLLCVLYGGGEQDRRAAQLWHRSNYAWYLKYEVRGATCFSWDRLSPMTIHLSLPSVKGGGGGGGLTLQLSWEYQVSHGGKDGAELSTIASIDQGRLLLTPLAKLICPPPMSAATLDSGMPCINSVAWGQGGKFATLGSDGSLQTYAALPGPPYNKPPVSVCGGGTNLEPCRGPRQLTWASQSCLAVIETDISGGGGDVITPFILDAEEGGLRQGESISGGRPLQRLVWDSEEGGRCVAHHRDGSLSVYTPPSTSSPAGSLTPLRVGSKVMNLGAPCVAVAGLPGGGVAGLTARGRLIVGGEEVRGDVTSFVVHSQRLLCTTTAHRLLLLPLPGGQGGAALQDDRLLERGALLVAAPPDDHRVIIQMPRGNLEAFHPRQLLLHRICSLLSSTRFKDAAVMMRRHRIDMNVLADYDPAIFALHASDIVRQLGPHLISLFIAQLNDKDVFETEYHNLGLARPARPTSSSWGAGASKVDAVCDIMYQALEGAINAGQVEAGGGSSKATEASLTTSVLLTFVRRSPPQVVEALSRVQNVSGDEREEMLAALLGMVDPKVVYDEALGLYDLELALHVAQASEQDPREYMPTLESLAALEDRACCIKIDTMLKRHDKALVHAIEAGEENWEQARGIMDAHRLYKVAVQALGHVEGRKAHWKEALSAHGRELVSCGGSSVKDGAAALVACGEEDEACSALAQCGEWESMLMIMHRRKATKDEIARSAVGMAETLRSSGVWRDAARLYWEYGQDADEAIATLCEGKLFVEATRQAYAAGRADLIETDVKEGLSEASTAAVADAIHRLERLQYIIARLDVIKEKEARGNPDAEGEDGDAPDDASEASSHMSSRASSARSSKSGRSSRSSRTNKTRSSTRVPKEGDPWEGEYLETTRVALIPTQAIEENWSRITEALVLFGELKSASELKTAVGQLREFVTKMDMWGLVPQPPPKQATQVDFSFL